MNPILHSLQERATRRNARVLLADSMDPRSIQAAATLVAKGIARPVLLGSVAALKSLAEELDVSLDGVECIELQQNQEQYALLLEQKRRHKGMSYAQALEAVGDPLVRAGLMLDRAEVECCVAGSTSSTASVLRAALHTVGLQHGLLTLSSYFLMIVDDRVLAYADCAVVPYPTPEQLCDIAAATAANYEILTQGTARLAFLSFSTKGSAQHASIENVREAVSLFRQRYPQRIADGELQADAALVRTVAQRKAPESVIQGDANVLVFPNLDAGNIAYKLTERLAGATALGPILQGLAKPYCDLSRGCSVNDIVLTACISILMSAPRE